MSILPPEARRGFALTLAVEVRPSTADGYLQVLDTYLRWCGDCDPYDRETLLSYLGDVAARATRATYLNYWKALKRFFEWADQDGVCSNAMAGLRRPRLSPDEAERDAPVYTEADRAALLAVCRPWTWIGLRDRAAIESLWYTGVRAGELVALDWTDVYWDEGRISVRNGKGGSRYRPALPAPMAAALHAYRRHCPYEGARHVFCGQDGGRMTAHALLLMVRRQAKRAGLGKKAYPHAFRHAFRARCALLGLSEAEIAALMGHRSLRATALYGRRAVEDGAALRYLERLAAAVYTGVRG